MNNKFSMIAGIAIFAVALGLSLQNAFDGYGVKSGNIHPEVLAQTGTGGGTTGDSTGSGTGIGDGTGGGSAEWTQFEPDPNKSGWQNFWASVGNFFNNVWDQIVSFFSGWTIEPIQDQYGNKTGIRFKKEW
jgi:hypothetical protein